MLVVEAPLASLAERNGGSGVHQVIRIRIRIRFDGSMPRLRPCMHEPARWVRKAPFPWLPTIVGSLVFNKNNRQPRAGVQMSI